MMNQTLRAEMELEERRAPRWDLRTWCLWILVGLMVASGVAIRVSIMASSVRFLMAATVVFAIFTALVMAGRLLTNYPRLLLPSIFFLALFVVWAVYSNVEPNQDLLREAYVRRLASHIGTPYVRGGETTSGVDSPGLARAALWEAMAKQGFTQLNSKLLGPTFWRFWWRDMSAKDMLEGKYGYTRVIGHAKELAGYDTGKLKEGDLAIAGRGAHVLIYFGQDRWIHANPSGKVILNKAPKSLKQAWFNQPVTFVRWRILEGPRHKG